MTYPICEPLKVRVITKGNAFAYQMSKGLQKSMFKHLKVKPQFQLIGETVTRSNAIAELVNKSKTGLWVSGDYSGATDLIKIQLTKMAFEIVLKQYGASEEMNEIFRKVLYEHEIHYPPNTCIPSVMQQNGQLMGSILSFPILCAINLAHYWITVRPDALDLQELNVLVNGDDILFRCEKDQYENWFSNLHEAGFVPSPGKNFIHPKYFTINSQLYASAPVINKQKKYTYENYTKIPFFNTGLLYGQSKVAADDEHKPVYLLHNECIQGANDQVRASKRFIAINNSKLKACSRHFNHQLNYYFKPELGGLGMNVPKGSVISNVKSQGDVNYNMFQVAFATKLFSKWTQPYYQPPAKPAGIPSVKLVNEDDSDTVNTVFSMEPETNQIISPLLKQYSIAPLPSKTINLRIKYPSCTSVKQLRLLKTIPQHVCVVENSRLTDGPQLFTNSLMREIVYGDMATFSYKWKLPRIDNMSKRHIDLSMCFDQKFIETTPSLENLLVD